MHAVPEDLRLLPPKGWPEQIRSSVIHVISLAHFSATFTRSVAANSINARIRLNAENNAQRRPHYPPIERMAILELRAARGWSLVQTQLPVVELRRAARTRPSVAMVMSSSSVGAV